MHSPIFAFAQYKVFKGPFKRQSADSDSETASLAGEQEPGTSMTELLKPPPRMSRMQLLKSRFSVA